MIRTATSQSQKARRTHMNGKGLLGCDLRLRLECSVALRRVSSATLWIETGSKERQAFSQRVETGRRPSSSNSEK
eukprot:3075650-Amphidinium_carterae.3